MKETIEIASAENLEKAVLAYGFLPFFKNEIKGFSVEEMTQPALWMSDTEEGPWEWKGPVARGGKCVYGKLFQKKAGFVSLDWFPDFVNYRRDGYDFDSRYEEGLVSQKDKAVYEAIAQNGTITTGALKKQLNYGKNGNKGFETVITRLQMQTYVIITDFEYMRDKYGKEYGWGVERYGIPEMRLGAKNVTKAYSKDPGESRAAVLEYLRELLPQASEGQILKIIG